MPLPETTGELLRWIETSGVLRRVVDAGEALGVLSALADSGDVRGIRYAAPLVLSEDLVLARGAAGTLEELFAGSRVDDFICLERNIRYSLSCWYRGGPWREVQRSEVQRLATRSDHPTATYGLLTMHWNGHVREEALRGLTTADPRAAAPFVLLRLNDWVEEVRRAAKEIVTSWLERFELLPLALNLPLVVRLRGRVRARHEGLVEEIEQRLLEEEPTSALKAACRSRDRTVCREAFALALGSMSQSCGWVIDEGLRCSDPVIRLRTLRRIVAADGDVTVDVSRLRRALDDPFMPVRREALQALLDDSPELGRKALEDAVLDWHPAIRYTARWRLFRDGEKDFAARYRDILRAPPSRNTLFAAVAGLGEVGSLEDLEAIRPFLEHPAAKIRAAAVRSAGKLSPTSETAFLVERLLDQSPKVSREAGRALRDRAHLLGGARLWELFRRAETSHGRRQLLHLFTRLSVGERLIYMLRVAATPEEPLANEALGIVSTTLDRPNLGCTSLSRSEAETIRQELEVIGPRLNRGTRLHLGLLLTSCSR